MVDDTKELTAEDVKRRHAEVRAVLDEWRGAFRSSGQLADLSEDDRLDFKSASKDRDAALFGVAEHERVAGASLDTAKAKLAIDCDYASYLGGALADRMKAAGQEREAEPYFEQGEKFAAEAETLNSEAVFERYVAASQTPVLTLDAIAADPWNAVTHRIPDDASPKLLQSALSGAEYSAAREHHLMMEARAGRNEEGWSQEAHDAGEPQPDVHEYNEARWFDADQRAEALRERLNAALEREGYLETLRMYDPTTSIPGLLAEEGEEFDHTPAQGPVTEALSVLGGNRFEGEDYPVTIGEFLERVDPQGRAVAPGQADETEGIAQGLAAVGERILDGVSDLAERAIHTVADSFAELFGGGASTPEPRPVAAQERQATRRAAREAAEAEARAERDRRAAEQKPAHGQAREESRAQDGGISI